MFVSFYVWGWRVMRNCRWGIGSVRKFIGEWEFFVLESGCGVKDVLEFFWRNCRD